MCCFVCAAFGAKAQTITLSDANFKNALVSTNCVDTDSDGIPDADADTNNDGQIQMTEALAVTSLYVSSKNIATLSGVEFFTNLLLLNFSNNQVRDRKSVV